MNVNLKEVLKTEEDNLIDYWNETNVQRGKWKITGSIENSYKSIIW